MPYQVTTTLHAKFKLPMNGWNSGKVAFFLPINFPKCPSGHSAWAEIGVMSVLQYRSQCPRRSVLLYFPPPLEHLTQRWAHGRLITRICISQIRHPPQARNGGSDLPLLNCSSPSQSIPKRHRNPQQLCRTPSRSLEAPYLYKIPLQNENSKDQSPWGGLGLGERQTWCHISPSQPQDQSSKPW